MNNIRKVWPGEMGDVIGHLSDISQIVASVAVLVAIPFAIVQIRQATRARYLDAITRVFEEFRSEVFFQNRRFVYGHDCFDFETCSKEEKNKVESVINIYNRMSFLVEKKMVPKKYFLEIWSGALLASWQKLESYIEVRRQKTGFSDWAVHFEHLAEESEMFRRKQLGETALVYGLGDPPKSRQADGE